MSPRYRSLHVVLLATLLAGCAVEPSKSLPSAPSAFPSVGTEAPSPVSPSQVGPTVSTSPVIPSASPITTPTVPPSMPPAGPGDFVTPAPLDPATAWTGIRWRKLAASDPLAHVRSVTRWQGGFVALGDLAVTGASARTKVWVSADGRTWHLLGAGTFGPTAVVVGVAGSADGVVALTLESGTRSEEGNPAELASWTLTGPWQTWTSSDGLTWSAHPGPDFIVPRGMSGNSHPTLLAGAGDQLLAIALGGQPLAFSRDGIAWQTVSLDAFPGGPAGWRAQSLVAFSPGFVAVGSTPTRSLVISSTDGRAWASRAFPSGCSAGFVTAGRRGLIVAFDVGDPHTPRTVWCSSLDGRSWRSLPKLPPIGLWDSPDAQECRGTCPNGILLGNGERMFAYRNYRAQVGWTSLDGRSWRRLAFSGTRPPAWSDPFGNQLTKVITPFGVLFIADDGGSAWFGQPLT